MKNPVNNPRKVNITTKFIDIRRIVKSTHQREEDLVKNTRKVNSTTKFVDIRRIVKSTHQLEEPSKKQ